MTGYAYGFLFGFAIAFTSALAGSIVCFYFCRRWFKPQVRKLMAKNKSLKSVVRTVEKRGFRLLVLIRLAPYPFNIMNALLSATHISLQTFALATGMSLLKLTLHVYIGSTLSSLNEDDGPDDPNNPNKKHGGKALKIFVMVTSILFGIGIGLYVWVVARREIAIVEASRLDRRRRRRREESLRRGLSTNPNSGIELNDNIPGLDLGSRGLSLDQDNRSGRQGGEFTDLVGGYRTNYRNEEDDDHEDQSLFGLGGGGNQQRQPQGDSWRNVGANVDSSTDSDNSDFLDDDDDDEDDEFEDNGHDYGVDLNIQERGNSFLGGNRTNNYRDIAQNDEDDEGALDFSAHHIGLSDSPWRDDDEERGL
ncbi:hypothetical protein BGZ76_000607 [Entomortierella beljakovae]|nr:hypothetical protein BGZ76_000607 [Entomortierella beljakovae]